MKNPPWHRDEIILALDLYSRLEPGQIHARNPDIIELSRLLNRLPIFEIRPDEVKFRNPNGVALKLSNFLSIDPSYHGSGMKSYSRLDKMVFEEFQFRTELLRKVANHIKQIVKDPVLPNQLYLIPEFEGGEILTVMEGAVIYKLHKLRERNSKIVFQKKELEFAKNGTMLCEACTFDFHKFYGDIGFKYIECHHKVPLSDFSSETSTNLQDLALVCSNCHRMLHRKLDTLSIEGLRSSLGMV